MPKVETYEISILSLELRYTLDIARFQVEPGEGATPFDERQPGEEYDLASRYFAKSYETPAAPGALNQKGVVGYTAFRAGSNQAIVIAEFPVKMRSIPTLTFYNPNDGGNTWYNDGQLTNSGVAAVANFAGEDRVAIRNPQVPGDAIGDNMYVHWVADAEL